MGNTARNLTAQQLMFCREYVATIDLNGTKAAKSAGYSEKTARFQASHLLTKPNIQQEITRLMAERSRRVEITADRVVERLYKLCFYDVRKLFDEKGNLLPIYKLDDDTAPAIIGFTVASEWRRGKRQFSEQSENIRLANPLASLKLLGRHLGLFKHRLVIEEDEFDGKSAEELEYFAVHGNWPDEPIGDGGTPQAGHGEKAGG